ncbi:MAG TPA: serine/threonine-protein kinase [Tepidisphaeraceae bacterium]|jgi:serine/threonine protein kinase|nr:serine/threonine-protein kinase [Tepidisphaeraceae bacterium]
MAESDKPGTGLATNLDTEVGKFVLDAGLVATNELDFCREQQKQASDPNQRSLADLLVENNFLTPTQARRIKQQFEDRRSSQIPGYQLICMIGKGAMAKVYKARQMSLDRIVAIKVLPKRMSDSQEFVSRFYAEGKAAARLSHSNIVQAIDVGSTVDGFHYFVMEFIEGKTLYDLMLPRPHGDGRTFSENEALDITIQMAEALSHAHEKGLIHRDVKPKNIILTPQGVAKLTDLGLAREVDDKAAAESEAGKAYGTPYYISPEQIRGDVDIDYRADIYSLGATMYHLLTGRPPFEADTPSAVMHKHLSEPLRPPDHINTALSAGISEIIEVAMAKNRDERYANTKDMLEDLKAVRSGHPALHARRIVTLEDLEKFEESGKTVDIALPVPQNALAELVKQPFVIGLMTFQGVSLLVILILVVVLLGHK